MEAKDNTALCLKCHKAPQEYETNSCHHGCFCKTCAMKCASGGKCLICHEWYPNLQRIYK